MNDKKIDLKNRVLNEDQLDQVSGGSDNQNSLFCPNCGTAMKFVVGGLCGVALECPKCGHVS